MKTLDQVEARVIVNATNTPGDATNTFIITNPGSYYFVGNITGAAGKNGISVRANDVTLDLNGFALLSPGGANLRGVDVPSAISNFTVRNGSVRGWSIAGVKADAATTLAEKLNLSGNAGGYGLMVGNGSMVRDCVASANASGFYLPDRTMAVNCISTINTANGFTATSYVLLSECTSSRNSGIGFLLGSSTSLSRCSATRNDLGGISGGTGCMIADSIASTNTTDGIFADSDSTIRNCTSLNNTRYGISVTTSCTVVANSCNANQSGIYTNGPTGTQGERNNIDGNSCDRNQFGIEVHGLLNFVVRNSATGNSSLNFSIPNASLNKVGPIDEGSGTITSTSPWANFGH